MKMAKHNDDRFEALLSKAKVSKDALRLSDLDRMAEFAGSPDGDDFIEAAATMSTLDWDSGAARPEGYLELHTDVWSIDMRKGVNREAVAWALLTSALVREGVVTNSIVWSARLLAATSSLEVTIGAQTVEVVVRLTAVEVPGSLRKIVNPLDAAEFCAAVRVEAQARRRITVVDGVLMRLAVTD